MDQLRLRGDIIAGFVALVMGIFIIRLFTIQVLSSEYEGKANRNVIKTKTIIPPRGDFFDRNGKIYISNRPIFDLMVTPMELTIPDTSVLVRFLGMSRDDIQKGIDKAARHSRYKESILARYIEPEDYAALQEKLWNFNGIGFTSNNKRYYTRPIGANFLGYISEVDSLDIKKSDGYYQMGDMIGRSGIESSYESRIRGIKGQKYVLKDVYNREVGSYNDGEMDRRAARGKDLMLGIDGELQAFGEMLMHNKKGSIVAIEPSTGEIIAFVSAPTYDPTMLTGRELKRNWAALQQDSLKPLFNRPLMAKYPPGSIYKIAMSLAALNEGVVTPETFYSCGGGFMRNKGKPACHAHPGPLNLNGAIQHSCNAYFAATYMDFLNHPKFKDIYQSFNVWRDYMSQLGLGDTLGIDIPYEKRGNIPTAKFYDRWYGANRWKATTIISNAIGQGEIQMTPLQMANLACVVANRGYYVKPHFVKAMKDSDDKDWEYMHYSRKYTKIAPAHFEMVANAMAEVVSAGTGIRANLQGIQVCGKTGTVENSGSNHSVFICFAPKDNPKIALAVVVENAGGSGGTWAAPVCSLLIEQYLTGKIEQKIYELERINTADFIH